MVHKVPPFCSVQVRDELMLWCETYPITSTWKGKTFNARHLTTDEIKNFKCDMHFYVLKMEEVEKRLDQRSDGSAFIREVEVFAAALSDGKYDFELNRVLVGINLGEVEPRMGDFGSPGVAPLDGSSIIMTDWSAYRPSAFNLHLFHELVHRFMDRGEAFGEHFFQNISEQLYFREGYAVGAVALLSRLRNPRSLLFDGEQRFLDCLQQPNSTIYEALAWASASYFDQDVELAYENIVTSALMIHFQSIYLPSDKDPSLYAVDLNVYHSLPTNHDMCVDE